ncbi:MAG: response regulator [Candidatus Schekmanbacteria bacterium]|nr:response regulator [Candidatus Schekmanbacteria bacterium]
MSEESFFSETTSAGGGSDGSGSAAAAPDSCVVVDISEASGEREATRVLRSQRAARDASLRAQVAARQSMESLCAKLWTAVEQGAASIVMTDAAGCIEYVNPFFTRTTGYSAAEAVGKNPRILKSGLMDRAVYEAMWRALSAGQVWRGELLNRKKSGELYWEMASISPVCAADGTVLGYISFKEDITERKREAEELARAKEAADAATRAKSAFLRNMSHEIRTPMNGVLGMAELLVESGLRAEQQAWGEAIVASSGSLLSILNDVLDLSALEAHRLAVASEPFDPAQVVEGVAMLYGPVAARKRLTLRTSAGYPAPATVLGDPGRLRQVLANLVSNAVKFTNKGEITLRTDFEAEAADEVLVRFTVSDTGIGICEADQAAVFEPFAQACGAAPRPAGGSGLGLAIARELVALMGGEISVRSLPDAGSTFAVVLPFRRPPAAAAAPSAPSTGVAAKVAARPWRILVAEDNGTSRELVAAVLKRAGHQVAMAADGREAVDAAGSGDFDLVLMDCEMPVLNGYEATRQIRAREPRRRAVIIALTAHALPEDRERCLAAGMDDFVTKPVSPKELRELVSRWQQ